MRSRRAGFLGRASARARLAWVSFIQLVTSTGSAPLRAARCWHSLASHSAISCCAPSGRATPRRAACPLRTRAVSCSLSTGLPGRKAPVRLAGATPEPPGTVTFGGLASSALMSHHGAWSRKARNVSGEGGELRLAPVSARVREQARAAPCPVTAGSLLVGVAYAGPDLHRGSRMVDQFVLSKHLPRLRDEDLRAGVVAVVQVNRGLVGGAPWASMHLPSGEGLLSLAVGLSSEPSIRIPVHAHCQVIRGPPSTD